MAFDSSFERIHVSFNSLNGMRVSWAIDEKPTGSKDPFALRRHALGIVRMLMERDLPLGLGELLADTDA